MILIIQLCMIFLMFYIFWCEWDTTFSEKIPSHILRITLCILLSVGVYKVDFLTDYHATIQFSVMVVVLFVTFLTTKFIINKYEKNRVKQTLRKQTN